MQEEPPKHERRHDCGRRRRHQVVVEPSSHGGSVVWRGRVLLGWESRSGVDRHQVDDEGHVMGRGHQQAMANRQGICKIRDLEVRYLWLQEMAKSGAIAVRKMNGAWNLADVLTKPMRFSEMLGQLVRVHLCSDLGLQSHVEGEGRHNVTPVGFCSAFSFACPCHSVHQASRSPLWLKSQNSHPIDTLIA